MELILYRHTRNCIPKKIERSAIAFFELTIVLAGTVTYLINGETVSLTAGDAVFIGSGTERERPEVNTTADYVSFNFHFAPDTPVNLPVKIEAALNNEIKLFLVCADEILSKHYPNADEQIAKILDCILTNIKATLTRAEEHPLVSKIKDFLMERLSEKVTLKKIGEITYFSPVYCDVVFKRETGKSMIDFLLDARIEEAKKLLSDGTLPLQKISEYVGFDDYNYFSRTFKKRTGYTASEYRKAFLFDS